MDGGLIEFEVRSLPGVVAAAVDGSEVTVLVLPTIDADAIRVVVAAVLAAHGFDRTIRVLGGMASPAGGTRTGRRIAVGAVGVVGGVAMLAGAAAGVAAVTGAFPTTHDPAQELAAPSAATASPRPSTPTRSEPGVVVQPGGQPTWAADEGAWPLPAILPVAAVAPPPAVVPAIVDTPTTEPAPSVVPIDPPTEKEPAPITGTGPTVPAANDDPPAPAVHDEPPIVPDPPAIDPDTSDGSDDEGNGHGRDSDDEGNGHGRDDERRHFGWTNGPAHASPNSSAATAPRGGHR